MSKIENLIVTDVTTFSNVDGKGLVFEYEVSDTKRGFYHRLRCGDAIGYWSGYSSPAVLEKKSARYVVVTCYYEGSVEFPKAETVLYKIETLPTKGIHCNLGVAQ